jgi:hypothetical protein
VSPHPKNPRRPRHPLVLEPKHVVRHTGRLYRIHRVRGAHPSQWDNLRAYGPLPGFRWDPHPSPLGDHPEAAVSYTAPGFITAFSEVFQRDRAITVTSHQVLSGWEPTRPLELLDLCGSDWALRNGASASLPHVRKDICQGWAHAIWSQFGRGRDPLLDGLLAPSTVIGDPMIVLWPSARSAFPAVPAFSRPLIHPDVAVLAVKAGRRLGWPVR